MSMIETISDIKNSFLSRREITCTFAGVGGKLKKLDAIDMIKKEFKLEGKFIIPIKMKNHTGRPSIVGTLYIDDDAMGCLKAVGFEKKLGQTAIQCHSPHQSSDPNKGS